MSGFAVDNNVVSWGRTRRLDHHVARPHFRDEIASLVSQSRQRNLSLLAIGLGRSYGDTGLNDGGGLVAMSGIDRLISFDPTTGMLDAEAGVSLGRILDHVLPQGWFLPVAPGTEFVTIGGAIASDIHGKNHHSSGTFGRWLREIRLYRTDGSSHILGPGDGLFDATIGGLGLTGIILSAKIQLKPVRGAEVRTRTIAFSSLDEYFSLATQNVARHEYNVAWIDCRLGRGLYTVFDHSDRSETSLLHARARWSIPFELPSFALRHLPMTALNAVHFRLGAMQHRTNSRHYAKAFFPLDSLSRWNLAYGHGGLYQYQCVVPPSAARPAIAEMLTSITRSGMKSFLSVLKSFGPLPSPGLLSFPQEGTTFSLDFPNMGAQTLSLFDRLDAIVGEAGGRLYAAKDARMSPKMFRLGYKRLEDFSTYVDEGLSSTFWRRLGR